MWTKQQIRDCQEAANKVTSIIFEAFYLIKEYDKVTEYEVQQYIHKRYKEEGLVTDQGQIVAFGKNTGFVHYYPDKNSDILTPNILILIDCWARLDKPNAPFCDTTWMAYHGDKVPKRKQEIFDLMIKARDDAIALAKREIKKGKMPFGLKMDGISRRTISNKGHGDKFMHTLGHSLGLKGPHGEPKGLNRKNDQPLEKNLGYTIEPGIYFENDFGVRSEIDFYITDDMEFVLMTPLQKKIFLI